MLVATLINPYGVKIFYVFYWSINAYKTFVVGTFEEYSVAEFLRSVLLLKMYPWLFSGPWLF